MRQIDELQLKKEQNAQKEVQLVINGLPVSYKCRLKAFAAKHGMSIADAIKVAVEVIEDYEKKNQLV